MIRRPPRSTRSEFYSPTIPLTMNLKLLIFLVTFLLHASTSLHLKGSWRTGDFFHFLVKFGFQKTILQNRGETQGYIYGNITSNENVTHPVTLAVLDRGYFLEYYGNSSVANRELACALMTKKISSVAYDSQCFDDGKEDFLRKVPCPLNGLCVDEDKQENVVKGHQFTYAIQDLVQPRFWYISFVACHRDPSKNCTWKPVSEDYTINYDIHLVNGNPYSKHQNPLEYEFSFDKQDTVEIYLATLAGYICLLPLQLYAVMRQKHPVPRLFTIGLVLGLSGEFFNVIHSLKFAFDGIGFMSVAILGDVMDILSQTLLMLLLLLLAKGWAVTHMDLSNKPLMFIIWALYGIIHVLLYVWYLTKVEVIDDIDEYQTWPGWLILVLRTAIMAWFLHSLRTTMAYEHQKEKLDFFLHFGAASLVWFIYLPIVALIALQVSALWRAKLLLGITCSANFFAYAVMSHLLWPTRSQQYFLLADDADLGDELEEFNEAPHVRQSNEVNSRAQDLDLRFTHLGL
uniref:EOG090X03T7 n=1 Tax=Lynceus sp. MCZ IZ 141354 TaxID=1930659 RepID=A0A9N6WVN1_9CRUS|nr:EOG090X03T7 [Lynceus sp. MCZ IZ 141354]